jgi:hypothetical protein
VRLDHIELALRRRSPWEAIDLGLVMVRHWRGPLYRVWLMTVLPVAVAILALLWRWPLAGMLIVWWLKPVADRVLLKFFAEATFGEPPTPREVWRSLPTLVRESGLLSRLTLWRFSPYRSFELPMLQLEGQHGKALRLRQRALFRKVSGYAIYLMQVCACVVVIFVLGQTQLVGLLIPNDVWGGFSLQKLFQGEANLLESHCFNLAWLLAESIVEPFYVAGGFSLYLNRRSELEGWDIEMAFRNMAERHADEPARSGPARSSTRGAGLMVAVAALLLGAQFVVAASDALAALAPADEKTIDGEARRALQEVLSDPVFGREVEKTSWQWRESSPKQPPTKPPPLGKYQLINTTTLATITRGVVFLLVAAGLAVVLVILYRYSGRLAGKPPSPARVPESLFGLDLRPSSLPADIPAAAWAQAEAGHIAAALSLLYRGTLVALIEHDQVPFNAGDTENVCLRRFASHGSDAARAYFSALLEAWKASAYAGSPPALAEVSMLCQTWREHFGRGDTA